MLFMIGLGLLGSTSPAQAQDPTFAINIVGPGPFAGAGITVIDNGPGDSNGALGQITVIAGAAGVPVIPGFTLSVDTAFHNRGSGQPFGLLDLNYSLSAIGGAGGTVQITTSAQNFVQPPAGLPATLTSNLNGNGQGTGTIVAQQWANLSNTLFGLGAVTPGPQGPFPVAPAYADEATIGLIGATPYSITDRITITLAAGASTTGDLQSMVTAIPAPGALTLALTALPFLGVNYLRRRWKK
jgi:hypothetical protein